MTTRLSPLFSSSSVAASVMAVTPYPLVRDARASEFNEHFRNVRTVDYVFKIGEVFSVVFRTNIQSLDSDVLGEFETMT